MSPAQEEWIGLTIGFLPMIALVLWIRWYDNRKK